MRKSMIVVLAAAMLTAAPALSFAGRIVDGNSVNSAAIIDGEVSTVDIANGAVTTDKIAAGAVTGDKLAGSIGVDKVGTYAGVKVVHTGPADGVNTFNSINAAMQASERGGLVKVMPGTYNEVVNLNKYVTIEGSGKELTSITAQANGPNSGCDAISLKNLTISGVSSWCMVTAENIQSNGTLWVAWSSLNLDNVFVNGAALSLGSVNINNTTINGGELHISGGAYYSRNVSNTVITPAAGQSAAIFVFNTTSPNNPPSQPLVFNNVTVNDGAVEGVSLGQGVWVKFINSTLRGSNSGANIGNTYDIFEAYNSTIVGGTSSLSNVYAGGQPVKLVNTQLNSGETFAGSVKMVNCYDTNLVPFANQ